MNVKEQKMSNLTKIGIFMVMIYFTWAFIPFMQGYFGFFINEIYAVIFVGLFVIGLFLLQLSKASRIAFLKLLVFAIFYLVFHLLFILSGEVNTLAHFYRTFIFWSPLFAFSLLYSNEGARIFLTKYLLILLIITFFTSMLQLSVDASLSRRLVRFGGSDTEGIGLYRSNLAGIGFFQMLILFVPVLVHFLFKKKNKKIIILLLLAGILIALLKASFTIALLMYMITLAICVTLMKNKAVGISFLIIMLLIFTVIPLEDVFRTVSANIDNRYISVRLNEIANVFSSSSFEGNLYNRIYFYERSMNTFAKYPFGIGPIYENLLIDGSLGVGYHSQIFDDLARYGIFALIMHVAFFISCYRFLNCRWESIGGKSVALCILISYFLALCLNLGMRSIYEGIMLFFILPTLPDIIRNVSFEKQNKEKKA